MEVTLKDLITTSHTVAAAENYRTFIPTDEQLALLKETGVEVLRNFPSVAGACAMMSACYADRLQMNIEAPVYVVAGVLSIGTTCVFGKNADTRDWRVAFNKSNPSWDGHCWVVFGDRLADISIFRTAYSQNSPPLLARHVTERFGKGRGLLISKTTETGRLGFRYKPQYVLTNDQVTALVDGARQFFQ